MPVSKVAPPQERFTPPARAPGGGAPLLHGIRVLELATIVAGPSASLQMARLGAEVVKVESLEGDPFRWLDLPYEPSRPHRRHGAFFEGVNYGKHSVALDLKTNHGLSKLKALLAECDVFITNVRLDGLVRLGLDYATVHSLHPHVVYAHLTAWGTSGPDYKLPGYDIGAFWAQTGMASLAQEEGAYNAMPTAFGDTATGSTLVAGIGIALAKRVTSGKGQQVHASLLGTGMFAMGCELNKAARRTPHAPASSLPYAASVETYTPTRVLDPTYTIYRTKDDLGLVLLNQGLTTYGQRLRQLFSTQAKDLYPVLSERFRAMTLAQAAGALAGAGLAHARVADRDAVLRTDDRVWTKDANCFVASLPGTEDMRLCVPPYDLHCSKEHVPTRAAPFLGAHTGTFTQKGWSPVHPKAVLKRSTADDPPAQQGKGVLDGVTVVELSEFGLINATACVQLAEYGARVIKVETPTGDIWRTRDPATFSVLNRGKESLSLDLTLEGDRDRLLALLQTTTIFSTNLRLSQLRGYGLDYESLCKRFPGLIYALVTPWGLTGPEENRGDIGAWYAMSGVADHMSFPSQRPPELPQQMGAIVSSNHLLAGIGLALFHLTRTGEGQLVDANLLRMGTWSNIPVISVLSQVDMFGRKRYSKEGSAERNLGPTFTAYRTKDGMWIQLLGLDAAKHLMPFLSALGIKVPVLLKVIPTALWSLAPLPTWLRAETDFVSKVTPSFRVINNSLKAAIESLTFDEVRHRFETHESNMCWFTTVNTPHQALQNRQAQATGVLVPDTPLGTLVAAPIRFSSSRNPLATQAPSLSSPQPPPPEALLRSRI